MLRSLYQMKIISAIIIQNHRGADHVSLETDLPDPGWPYTGKLNLDFKAAKGSAEKYIHEHFPGIPIDIRSDPITKGE